MRSVLRRFAGDIHGNFAILSAIVAVPLAIGAGVAVDLSTVSSTRSALQQAIDSAVLAIAREGKDIPKQKAQEIAGRFIEGNFDPAVTKLVVEHDGTAFKISATTKAHIAFGGLFGYDDIPINTAATADIAYASYEIALVLDTTGSMAGGKLAAMKDAVLGLVDTMSTEVSDKDKLKFAMVPFAAFVNVGPTFGPKFKKQQQVAGSGAPWLDLDGSAGAPQSELTSGASRFQIYQNLGKKWSGCVETRYSPGTDIDVDDTRPDASKPATLFMPALAVDEPDTGGYSNSYIKSDAVPNDPSVAEKKKRWKKYGVDTDASGNPLNGGLLSTVTGLLTDLLTGLQAVALDPAVITEVAENKKGPGAGCDVEPIVSLGNDYKKLKKKIGDLKAAGTTNIMEGVAWGSRVLSPGEPFAESTSAGKNIEQIMIVLTDGTNNFGTNKTGLGSTYSAEGYLVDGRLGVSAASSATTTDLLNKRTLAACDVAKKAGVEVYTIRLEEPDVATGTMLKECATTPDHYIDVPSRTQLDDAFGKIKEKIVRVRMSS